MTKVLFDHNMPPSIARALNELIKLDGHEAFALREKFPTNISDIDYFNQLGIGWIVISKDLQNSRKKAERAAILRNKVVAFYLSPALLKKKINEQAAAIIWHWDKILVQRNAVENGLFQLPENKSKFRSL
ncbi:PIN-like domain-containing protein [Roseovarius ramblicola]|uniref:VapC45 PIN like domain-containing protein n=1 Tax=Roseovarius ramblicola TaxID=2022336 RepID=A0ABV5HXP9_9RHOB